MTWALLIRLNMNMRPQIFLFQMHPLEEYVRFDTARCVNDSHTSERPICVMNHQGIANWMLDMNLHMLLN